MSKHGTQHMMFQLEFSEGWGVLEKIPSVGEVRIFSGITKYDPRLSGKNCNFDSQFPKETWI